MDAVCWDAPFEHGIHGGCGNCHGELLGSDAAAAHQVLVETSEKLSMSAIGTTLKAAMREALSQGKSGKWEAGKNRIEIMREDWPTGKGYEVKFIIR